MYTSWRDIEAKLFPVLRGLPSVRASPAAVSALVDGPPGLIAEWQARLQSAAVYRHMATNADAVLNTLRYMFFHMRCGVLVCVRGGSVAVFAPFANAAYTNTFAAKLLAHDDVAAYQHHKARATRRAPEQWLPPARWWMNGGMVCNVMPPDVWGPAHFAEIQAMLQTAADVRALPDCDFFLNKRDYPHLRCDAGEPLARFTGVRSLVREAYTAYAPIVSFYGGDDFADLLMPLTEDWLGARASAADADADARAAFDAAACRAVWRGSATGYGITDDTNPRLRLWRFAATEPRIDVAFTAVNGRDKLLADGTRLGYLHGVPLGAYMPADAQAARFRYSIYVDGHCAANRYGAMMRARRVILKIDTVQRSDCGQQWLFPDLRGVCVPCDGDVDATALADADHFMIHADLSNMGATLSFLDSHVDAAWRVACNAAARAPTTASIVAAWQALLACMHAAQVEPAAPDGVVWFSPFEPAYAAIGSSMHDPAVPQVAFTTRVR